MVRRSVAHKPRAARAHTIHAEQAAGRLQPVLREEFCLRKPMRQCSVGRFGAPGVPMILSRLYFAFTPSKSTIADGQAFALAARMRAVSSKLQPRRLRQAVPAICVSENSLSGCDGASPQRTQSRRSRSTPAGGRRFGMKRVRDIDPGTGLSLPGNPGEKGERQRGAAGTLWPDNFSDGANRQTASKQLIDLRRFQLPQSAESRAAEGSARREFFARERLRSVLGFGRKQAWKRQDDIRLMFAYAVALVQPSNMDGCLIFWAGIACNSLNTGEIAKGNIYEKISTNQAGESANHSGMLGFCSCRASATCLPVHVAPMRVGEDLHGQAVSLSPIQQFSGGPRIQFVGRFSFLAFISNA